MSNSIRSSRQPTLQDVASAAGVSAQTVSRVINGKGGVSESKRDRILATIDQLGYRPNALARGLATSQSRTIGLVVTDFAQGFFPDTTRGIELEAAKHGYAVYIATFPHSESGISRTLDRLRDDRFAGVIINAGIRGHEAEIRRAVEEGFPVVLIHEEVPGVPSMVHWPGYKSGAILAMEHLISIGRRHIGYLGSLSGSLNDQDKLYGYIQALERAGLPVDERLIIRSERDFQSGFSAAAELYRRNPDLDAIFTASDVRAVGALRYFARAGVDIPNDIAIVAFGASTMASMVTPSLSSIAVPRRELGHSAVQVLLQVLQGDPPAPKYVHEQPVLVLGESSMPSADRRSVGVPAPEQGAHPLLEISEHYPAAADSAGDAADV